MITLVPSGFSGTYGLIKNCVWITQQWMLTLLVRWFHIAWFHSWRAADFNGWRIESFPTSESATSSGWHSSVEQWLSIVGTRQWRQLGQLITRSEVRRWICRTTASVWSIGGRHWANQQCAKTSGIYANYCKFIIHVNSCKTKPHVSMQIHVNSCKTSGIYTNSCNFMQNLRYLYKCMQNLRYLCKFM